MFGRFTKMDIIVTIFISACSTYYIYGPYIREKKREKMEKLQKEAEAARVD